MTSEVCRWHESFSCCFIACMYICVEFVRRCALADSGEADRSPW